MTSEKLEGDWQEEHRKRVAAMPSDVREAHAHCRRNWVEITASETAGCFYCVSMFAPNEIQQWYDEKTFETGKSGNENSTAFCPRCQIDSVIGSKSGFPMTTAFLDLMRSHWF